MFYKDQNGKPFPKENYGPRPTSVGKSINKIERYENGTKIPLWVYGVVVLAIVAAAGGWWWSNRKTNNKQQEFGFHFY